MNIFALMFTNDTEILLRYDFFNEDIIMNRIINTKIIECDVMKKVTVDL